MRRHPNLDGQVRQGTKLTRIIMSPKAIITISCQKKTTLDRNQLESF